EKEHVAPLGHRADGQRVSSRQREQHHDDRRDEHDDQRVRERRRERQRSLRRVADLAVASEREALVQRLSRRVLFGLEARQERPPDGEDPEHPDHPGGDPEPGRAGTALADPEPRSPTCPQDHARSSSFRSPDSTRSENVAMTIEKMTTTIAYADAEP